MGNISAKGQTSTFHGGPVYFMRRVEKSQDLALVTVTFTAHRTDHTLALLKGESPESWPDLPCAQGLRAHLG